MPGLVRGYADSVAAVLGGPAQPHVAELLDAADVLDAAFAEPDKLPDAITKWRAAEDALRDRLVDYLLSWVPVPVLPLLGPGDGWDSVEGPHLDGNLGPLDMHIESPPLRVADPRPAMASLVIGPLPPNSLTAHLDAARWWVTARSLCFPMGSAGRWRCTSVRSRLPPWRACAG